MQNRLDHATSPYLLQHADNPVAWQPWDQAALAAARESGRPVLLSIGYSACHWCHVMAHESFADAATAELMNALFVNIKLDREQRPDLDRYYQLAHQAMTGRPGGWPLTAFLDPVTLAPFFAGTYFPPQARHGLPGFRDVLRRVREYFDDEADARAENARQLKAWLSELQAPPADSALPEDPERAALVALGERFDHAHGGSAGAPKFPRASEIEWLLDYAAADADENAANAADMAHTTLMQMARGGLQDHLGGGFFRYCVDDHWEIPHFEKMLYDNAQLLSVYARAARTANNADFEHEFKTAALAIVAWLQREMRLPEGGHASALDADRDGEEGAFYLWNRASFEQAVPKDAQALATAWFGLDRPPNFEGRAWHLTARRDLADVAATAGVDPVSARAGIDTATAALLTARSQRAAPARDDKLLTGCNALAVTALYRTGTALGDRQAYALADATLDTLRRLVWIDGQLHASHAGGRVGEAAFLDDHALLVLALLDALSMHFDGARLQWAQSLADHLIGHFEDGEHGGFFFSSPSHQPELERLKPWTDDNLPSGNGAAALALLRLGHLLGETRYLDAAERTLRAGADALRRYPAACPALLRAWREWRAPAVRVVVRCASDDIPRWRTAAGQTPIYAIPDGAGSLPGLLERQPMREGGVAYVCHGHECLAPITTPDALIEALGTQTCD